MEDEEWKDVLGYEGVYKVSSYGRLFYLGREKGEGTGNYARSSRMVKFSTIKNGYLTTN